MSINFASPSYRASSSDLTVAISPLGLVELADEEFEVHGPRLNRYAQNWAWYLGHHWSYRREMGEQNITFNYCKALSDYTTNFTFGKGIDFKTPAETEGIAPYLLRRVWEIDNAKESLLWEIGNLGSVSGDVFVKVAYEEPYVDPAGRPHPGRVRIIPINPAFAFPEFHPHDRSRLIRFKLKYRFWGTSLEGTRQVFTYVELMTENSIEEYVNDELIDSRPNPLGTIPIVHIPNLALASSPWGLSDIADVVSLNREYNEKATDISDIINYHAAPITIITGAKASQLERGPKKVWGGLPKDANVFNLQGTGDIAGVLEYLQMIKRTMHEMTGVPEGGLGEMQPISNTSGVALAMQYQPMMNRYNQKKIQYGLGFQKINELVMLTLALKEPWTLQYNPEFTDVPLKPNQYPVLDPADPMTYQSEVIWPSPLPLDYLVKLNEIGMKMQMGLESKRGALRDLGEEVPDQKMAEIFSEQLEDIKEQGALDLVRTQIMLAQAALTGMPMTDPSAEPVGNVTSAEDGGAAGVAAGPPLSQETIQTAADLNTLAYGTKLPQVRNQDKK